MFKKFFLLELLLFSIAFLSFDRIYAQEKGKIIVISERIGEVIDLEERNKYKLFLASEGFIQAVLLKLPDGSYVFKITHLDETTGEEKIQSMSQTELQIINIRKYINSYEEINVPEPPLKRVDEEIDRSKKPPLKTGKIAGEIFIGLLGEVAFFALGAEIGDYDFINGTGSAPPAFAGLAIGSAAGVYLIGCIGDQTGSPIYTLSGSILGMLVGFSAEGFRFWGMLILPPVGATIGFNKTRRYDTPSTKSALINFRDGKMIATVPAVYFRPSPSDGRTITTNVNLFSAKF